MKSLLVATVIGQTLSGIQYQLHVNVLQVLTILVLAVLFVEEVRHLILSRVYVSAKHYLVLSGIVLKTIAYVIKTTTMIQ